MMECTRCKSDEFCKAGFIKGKQRYVCKVCNYQYVPKRRNGNSQILKLTALLLLESGLDFDTIVHLLEVSSSTLGRWRKQYTNTITRPGSQGITFKSEVDEVCRYLQTQYKRRGSKNLVIVLPVKPPIGKIGAIIVEPLPIEK